MASTFGSKALMSLMGTFFGKLDKLSTSKICLSAPMLKKISVALGEREMMRLGSFSIVVLNPPDEIVSGYFVVAACAGVVNTDAKTIATIATVSARRCALNIKKLPQEFEGGKLG
jgi:hypothetical protein